MMPIDRPGRLAARFLLLIAAVLGIGAWTAHHCCGPSHWGLLNQMACCSSDQPCSSAGQGICGNGAAVNRPVAASAGS